MSGMNARRSPGDGLLGTVLAYGALWGAAEATVGHLLHLARVPGLPGLAMVPFAVWIMGRAAVRSRSAAAVFLAGAVAASLKLLDLFVPGTDLLALSRPVQAILLEALAGAVWVELKMGIIPFSPSRYTGAPPFSPALLPFPGSLSGQRGMLPRRSPSVERGPAQRGEPDDWFPGGRGARGISRAKPERGLSRRREKSLFSRVTGR
jgi:hypothetical protein